MALGALAQLGERRLCKAEVIGSSPICSIRPDGNTGVIHGQSSETSMDHRCRLVRVVHDRVGHGFILGWPLPGGQCLAGQTGAGIPKLNLMY